MLYQYDPGHRATLMFLFYYWQSLHLLLPRSQEVEIEADKAGFGSRDVERSVLVQLVGAITYRRYRPVEQHEWCRGRPRPGAVFGSHVNRVEIASYPVDMVVSGFMRAPSSFSSCFSSSVHFC